ncbi:MAG: glycosyltransferase family 4 protein [Bacteroidia bacterium]
MTKRILIVTNVPNPYRIALFNELNRQLATHNMELLVIFGAPGYIRRLSQTDMTQATFAYKILSGGVYTSPENTERTFFGYKGLMKEIRNYGPYRTIVIGFSPATIRLYLRSSIRNFKYIIWAGSILREGRNDSALRKMMRKLLIKRAKAYIAYGSLARDYFIKMGAPADKVAIAINTSDPSFFITETDNIRKQEGPNYGDGKIHLLYIGYLVRRKNVGLLIDLIRLLSTRRNDFVLDIVGDGESREELEKKVSELNLNNFVKFHGFRQKSELPRFLAKSNVFLFQTDFDVWGLTLNEAMAAALPVLSSVNAGATFDLVENGVNGYAVDYTDTVHVAELLEQMLNDPTLAGKMGEAGRKILIGKARLEISATGFIDAIRISEGDKR